MKGKINAKNIALTGILSAAALISFMVENLFPPVMIPGARIGVSNIFSMLALILSGSGEGVCVVVIKSVLGSLLTGNPGACIYSLTAGIGSMLAVSVLYGFVPKISLTALSVVGAVVHNIIQNVVYCLVTSSVQLFRFLPYLILLGVLSGLIVGVAIYLIVKKVPERVFEKIIIKNGGKK